VVAWETLALLDWKRRVFSLYAGVRAADEPAEAWQRWREARDELFRTHPQSPLPEELRASFVGLEYWPYDADARVLAELDDVDAPPETIATSGGESYGGGRYLLDTVKGSDLGQDDGRLVLDFNFAYNPSCAYDPGWVCPLAPPANRLAVAVRAGERYAA